MQKGVSNLFKACLLCVLISFYSCKSAYVTTPFNNLEVPAKPDYQDEKSWAVLPSKYIQELKALVPNIDSLEADVFYVYPTLITHRKDIRWNVASSDKIQNEKVLYTAVRFQASAWAKAGKLYVPYYRQAHLRSYSHLKTGGEDALLLAYSDVKAAFTTYLEKYNNGRPIIIAGHSQGATHCRLLLKDFFDGKPLQKQLVAAYLPGVGVAKNEFEMLRIMIHPDETGGFVSWNTYKRNALPKKYEQWYKGKVTSNPITWDKTKNTKKEDHKGFLYRNEKTYKKALKIELIDGMVWTSLPRFPHRLFAIFKKNYHVGDVNLFWSDIQENAKLRVAAWLTAQED